MLQKIQFNQHSNKTNTINQVIPIKNKINFGAIQETIFAMKSDTFERKLSQQIGKEIIEKTGLEIIWAKIGKASREVMEAHYKEHNGKPFFPSLIDYTTRNNWGVYLLRGEDAVAKTRKAAGEIREKYSLGSKTENLVHSSDSVASAEREKQIHVFNNLNA